MARIRTIKPEFWQSEEMASLPDKTQLFAIGLLNHSDDEGYFPAHPALLKAAIFPFSEGSLNIHGMLTELSNIGYLEVFTGTDGKAYGLVVNFTKHQRVSRPTDSKIKELRQFTEGSVSAHGGLSEGSLPERKGKERKGITDTTPSGAVYAFLGSTIKLKADDYEKCSAQYPNLDIDYQLGQLDLELSGKKNWYVEMHSKLNYRNSNPAHHAKQQYGEYAIR